MRRESAAVYIFIAGFGYFFLAVLTLFILPYMAPVNNATAVQDPTSAQILEVRPYTPLEQLGRRVYIREGCFYCHSQYVRPLADEVRRYGPVGQIGEYAYDVPHLFGTRRIGPDLARVGGKVNDDWHYAHLYAPRRVVPDSIMPAYPWLFGGTDEGGRPRPTEEGQALVAYLQKLGSDLGNWRESFGAVSSHSAPGSPLPAGAFQQGQAVYRKRCLTCHGAAGDGRGSAASLLQTSPTAFTTAVFKFRSTPPGTLPTDGDLYHTISRGLRGTAMPPNPTLPEKERWYLVQVIKSFSPRWEREAAGIPIPIPPEPADSAESRARGEQLYRGLAGCWLCHGPTGRGNGPVASVLPDTQGHPLDPGDWSHQPWKAGGSPGDLFRTLSTGLDGTPMPAYFKSLRPNQRWDIVHYIRSLPKAPHRLAPAGTLVSDVIKEVE